MTDSIFIDTNIWIYAFLDSERDHSKQEIILNLLERISNRYHIVISVQIINEFHWILTRKYGIREETVRDKVMKGIAELADIVPLDFVIYQNAYKLRNNYTISFWDSLVVASALDNGCHLLYSEDMQDGLIVDNKMKILNPFVVKTINGDD